MWGRLRKGLMSAGLTLLYLAWFFGAVAIAMGPLGVEPQRGNLWVVMLIFLAPVFVMIAVASGTDHKRLVVTREIPRALNLTPEPVRGSSSSAAERYCRLGFSRERVARRLAWEVADQVAQDTGTRTNR